MIPKISIPKSPIPGLNQKILGRVKSVKPVTKTASAEGTRPVEFESASEKEKTAVASFLNKIPQPMQNAFWTGVGTVAAGGLAYGVGAGIDAARSIMAESKYDKVLKDAIAMSPTLQMHGYETLKKYLPLVVKSSPTVAAEPLLLANYLETMLDAQGHLNAGIFNELVTLEGNVLRNRQAGNGFRDAFVNTAVKGSMEGLGKGVASALGKMYSSKS